jgi:hypothetical protein
VLWWWVGSGLGWFLLDVDHLIDVFWLRPKDNNNQTIREAVRSGNWEQVWKGLLKFSSERKTLVLHSVLFELMVVVMSVYVLTSSSGLLPRGLLLGLWGRMINDQMRELLGSGQMKSWLWQLKVAISRDIQVLFLVGSMVVWAWLALSLV